MQSVPGTFCIIFFFFFFALSKVFRDKDYLVKTFFFLMKHVCILFLKGISFSLKLIKKKNCSQLIF